MSSKKETRKIDASDYLDSSFVRSLIFEHPEALIDELDRTKKPLESVLSGFEFIARKILKNEPESESIKFAAKQVILQAEKIRKAKDPETAAIAMMILSFSLAHAEASGMLLDGAKLMAGRRNKKAFKGLLGVLGAISHFLNEDETLTAKQLWKWRFKKLIEHDNPDLDHRLRLFDDNTGSEFEISFYENRIFQKESKKSGNQVNKSIGWESFRKIYVPKAKKMKEKW